jgi:hypothetical protein
MGRNYLPWSDSIAIVVSWWMKTTHTSVIYLSASHRAHDRGECRPSECSPRNAKRGRPAECLYTHGETGATPNGSAVRAPILEQTGGLVSRVHVWKPALLSRLAANVTPCWSTVPELRKNDELWVSGVLHEHGVHRMRISSGWLFKTVHTFHSEWGLHNVNLRNLTVG